MKKSPALLMGRHSAAPRSRHGGPWGRDQCPVCPCLMCHAPATVKAPHTPTHGQEARRAAALTQYSVQRGTAKQVGGAARHRGDSIARAGLLKMVLQGLDEVRLSRAAHASKKHVLACQHRLPAVQRAEWSGAVGCPRPTLAGGRPAPGGGGLPTACFSGGLLDPLLLGVQRQRVGPAEQALAGLHCSRCQCRIVGRYMVLMMRAGTVRLVREGFPAGARSVVDSSEWIGSTDDSVTRVS